MKVLYDYQCFEQQVGGVSRCFVELIKHIPSSVKPKVSLLLSNNVYLDEISVRHIHYNDQSHFLRKFCMLINRLFVIMDIVRHHYDIIHLTFDQTYLCRLFPKLCYVITIHDMIPEIMFNKAGYSFITKDWLRRRRLLINKARYIISISENTKRELLKYYPNLNPDKIAVIGHGFKNIELPKNYTPTFNIPEKYILFVGTRRLYKNFELFIEEVSPILHENDNLHIVCVGGEFDKDEKNMFYDFRIGDRIMQVKASDKELTYLYRKAIFLIFPSLYEGFGIPILEAWANECPILLSNCSCFPEIAAEAAVYFNPETKGSLTSAIKRMLTDAKLRNNLVELGSKRKMNYTWQFSSQALAEVYEKCLK